MTRKTLNKKSKRKIKTLKKSKKKTRKTKKNYKTKNKNARKKKRGAGPACSRPQLNEDNQSDYSDGSNPDYPIIAEQIPDNEPLPPGAQRIPTEHIHLPARKCQKFQ